jgi:hypothetical protein
VIIHFISNTKHLNEDEPYLRSIVNTIHNTGAVLARDWIRTALASVDSAHHKENVDWKEVFKEELAAFQRSDIVIIEATRYSFRQGFFISQAMEHKKPALVVARLDPTSHPLFGIDDKHITIKQYTSSEELIKIVNKFIKANTISTKDLRFNFFIDRQIYNFLREVSYETGKNKSEIIRELLEKEIDRQEQ